MALDQSERRIGGIEASLLNAYIDGELGPEQASEIERQLETDSAASRYVRQVHRVEGLAKASIGQVDYMAISRGLGDSLEALRLHQGSQAGQRWWQSPYLASAASVVLLLVGYSTGFLSAEYRINQQMAVLEAARSQSLEEVRVALNRVLEYSPSGEQISWHDETGRVVAELSPIRTLKSRDQRFCREFREVVLIDGTREERRGLSCRQGKEDWRTQLILTDGT